jgi:hypothetical protein
MSSHLNDAAYKTSEVSARYGEEGSRSGSLNTSSAKFGYGDPPVHDFDPSDPSSRLPQRQTRPYGQDIQLRDQYSAMRHFQGQHMPGPNYPPDEIRRAHQAPRSGVNFCPSPASTHAYRYMHNTAAFSTPIRNFHPQQPTGDNSVGSSTPAGGHLQQTPQKDGTSSDLDDQEIKNETSPPRDDSEIGCTCKKSKCLKLYCMCFAVKAFCDDKCRCLECSNDPRFSSKRNEAIQAVLARNPLAFENKFKPTIDKKEMTQHKNGCKCRKSMCLKKYCECFSAQINCGVSCRCVGCKNMPPGMKRPFSDHHPSTSALSLASKFNVYDAAHNLAFLKNMSPKRKDSSPDSEISPPTAATHVTGLLGKEEKKDDEEENHKFQIREGKEEKTNLVSTPLDTQKQELLDDTLAADLLLQAAATMTQREPQLSDYTRTPEKNIISNSEVDVNYPKRQLVEPKVPTMDPKRSKFEKDCKSPNSTASTNTVS